MSAVDVAAGSASPAAAATEDAGKTMVAVGGMQNMAWAADTSKFGFKMLVKMGWKAGKGVGKDLQGQASHVKIARRSENLGVGCSLKQAEVQGWSNTAAGFADVLKTLNKSYGSSKSSESDGDEADSDTSAMSDDEAVVAKKSKKSKSKKDKKAKKDKKKKSKKSKKSERVTVSRRLHYRKRMHNKDAKNYGAVEMAAILGVASSK